MHCYYFSKDTLEDNFFLGLSELQPTKLSALGKKFGLPCRLDLHIDDSVCWIAAFAAV